MRSTPLAVRKRKEGGTRALLKEVFSVPEAEALLAIGHEPKELGAIAERLHKREAEISELLAVMVEKGVAIKHIEHDAVLYSASPITPGWFEYMCLRRGNDADFMDKLWGFFLIPEHFKRQMGRQENQKTLLTRTIPVETAICGDSIAAPYERASEYVRNAPRPIAVIECACRARGRELGNPCHVTPYNVCLTFGHHADFFLKHHAGQEIDVEKALEIVHLTEEAGCVHRVTNQTNPQDASFLCNCCTCHCPLFIEMEKMQPDEVPKVITPSNFVAVSESSSCTGCGLCLDRCPVHALNMRDHVISIDTIRCIGCGLCVVICGAEAIKLTRRPEEDQIKYPETFSLLAQKMYRER